MQHKPIMIVGTSTNAGKTTLVAGLCRLFANRGIRCAPFKSQNFSLNSFATLSNEEIARSIAVQAYCAKQTPFVHMNPILLKPTSDTESQVIIHGKAINTISGKEYFASPNWYKKKLHAIKTSITYLKKSYDLIIAEGAGSFAEPNFRNNDVVNMGLAHILNADVYIVADIDMGGAFANILGSLKILKLLSPHDLKRIKGIIINKFRGDRDILKPALDFIVKHTKVPIAGIIPYMPNFYLEEEDRSRPIPCKNPQIDIAVIYLPHISNSNDFDHLSKEEKVRVRFVRSPDTLGCPDLIIIPGSKNASFDLSYLRTIGWDRAILNHSNHTPIMGICAGFEMMGKAIFDPDCVESKKRHIAGFGFFDFDTTLMPNKKVSQVHYTPSRHNPFSSSYIHGYEIHCGTVNYKGNILALHTSKNGDEGAILKDRLVFGTFIHDIFKNPQFTRSLVNKLRSNKNLPPLTTPFIDPHEDFEAQANFLADKLEEHFDNIKSFLKRNDNG